MFQNPYMPNYYNNNFNQQSMNDRIDNQIAQLQQMKEQMKNNQQPAINQTFQLAPSNHSGMKYVNTMDEVSKEQVFIDTPFFSKDMSVLWVKDNKGNIKSYELKEIVPLDEKDMQIEYLQNQIEELRKEMNIKNERNNSNAIAEQISTNTSTTNREIGEELESNKSTSVSKVSRSKKE